MTLLATRPRTAVARPDFDTLVDRFFRRDYPFAEREGLETTWSPNLDMTETDEEYLIRLEVPGIPRENLDVTLDANVLTLSGRREVVKDEENEKFVWHEREEGRFMRSMRLPTTVVEDKIKASVENGVLMVHLPKAEPAVKSRILIK